MVFKPLDNSDPIMPQSTSPEPAVPNKGADRVLIRVAFPSDILSDDPSTRTSQLQTIVQEPQKGIVLFPHEIYREEIQAG